MKKTPMNYFGRVTEVGSTSNLTGAMALVFKMGINCDIINRNDLFDGVMFDGEVAVVMVGDDTADAVKKIAVGVICEVKGFIFNSSSIHNQYPEMCDITKYIITDNVVIHKLA